MADLEYGSDFVLYLTSGGGLRYVTNTTLIQIVDLLTDSEMTIADISQAMDVPRSTIQSGVRRLVDMGIIGTYKDESDARKTYYWLQSLSVVRSSSASDSDPVLDKALVDSVGEASPIFDAAFVFLSEMKLRGADLSGILTEAGFMVGSLYRQVMDRMSLEEISERISAMIGIGCPVKLQADADSL